MARDDGSERAPIRLRGTPASLTGVIPEGAGDVRDLVISATAQGATMAGEPPEASVSSDADPRIVRVSLPPELGPGTYEAVVTIDGEERRVELQVEPSPRLRAIPEQLRIQAHPGDLVGADLTLLNQGNVPVQVRRVQAFGIFMEGGLERALRRAYVHRLEEGQRRVDVLADTLADAHGGLVKMKIQEGAGDLPPGAIREIAVTLELPADLQRGYTYGGNWELAGLVYPVTIVVGDGQDGTGDDEDEDDNGTGGGAEGQGAAASPRKAAGAAKKGTRKSKKSGRGTKKGAGGSKKGAGGSKKGASGSKKGGSGSKKGGSGSKKGGGGTSRKGSA